MRNVGKSLLAGSVALVAANAISGVLNYGYQVVAARELPVDAYGTLSVWLGELSVALALSTLGQMVGMFVPAPARRLRLWGALAAGVATTMAAAVALGRLPQGDAFTLAGLTLALGLSGSWLFGQLQARLAFLVMALAALAGSLTKMLAPLAWNAVGMAGPWPFYLAIPLSAAVGLAVVGIGALRARPERGDDGAAGSGDPSFRPRLAAGFLMAAGLTLFPQLDLLALKATQSAATLGEYARVALFGKMILFGALAILQVTLPLHLKVRQGEDDLRKRLWLLESALILGCAVATVLATWLGPVLSVRILGVDLGPWQGWIFVSCAAAAAQVSQLRDLQLRCAALDWRSAAIQLVAAVVPCTCAYLFSPATVERYLFAAFAWYIVVAVVSRWDMARRLPSQPMIVESTKQAGAA